MQSSLSTILKLRGWKNYHSWENCIYGLLAQHGFYQLFNEDFNQTTMTASERAKAAGIIITSLDEEVARKITVSHRMDPKGLLKFLKDSYGKSEASYVSIGISLLNLELNDISDIELFLENCKNLYNDINKLASEDEKLCEKFFVTIVLAKVKSKFRFITDLELNPNATINMATVFGKMISEARSIKNNQSSSDIGNSLNVMSVSKNNKMFCSYCKRTNHTIKSCFRRLRANNQNQDSSSSSSSTEPQSDHSDKFKNASGVSIAVNSFSVNQYRNNWLFDSGADNHFCCNRKLFKKIWKINKISISQFNPNDHITCDEYGSIDITTDTGILEIEAYYVPQGQNVISVTRLSRYGFSVSFTKSGLKITKDNDLVWFIENQTHGRFFSACPVQSSSKDWHNILGHADFNKLKILSQKYLFVQSKPYECDVCSANKMCKPKFEKSQHHHSKSPMEVVYADLCGPFPFSIHNQKYMLFHMFGSKAFIKLDHFENKLVPRASPVMFIGLDHSKFIVYDPKTNKITSSRNIKFTDEIYSIQDPNYETSSIFSNFIQQLDYHSKQDFDDDNYDSSDYVISEIPIIDNQTPDFNINLIHDCNSSTDEMSNHASLVNQQSDDFSASNDDLSVSNSTNDSEATIENNDLPIAWRKPDRSVKIPDRLGYLGIEIIKRNDGFYLSQSKYIESLSVQYQVNEAKYVKCPLLNSLLVDLNDKSTNFPIRNLIGSLLYIANWTRPDICTAVNQLSQYLHKPTDRLWRHALNVLKYLNSTKLVSLCLGSKSDKIIGFADANFATDSTDRKSVSGIAIFLFGSLVDWTSSKQKIVAESTSVAELIALHGCVKKLEILYCCLVSLNMKIIIPIEIYDDSQNVLQRINNGLSKAADVKLKYIIEQMNVGLIKLKFIPTTEQIADPLTKIIIRDYDNIRKNFGLILT
ncbi:copia protein [Dermatophagoides farinae]|uniref:Copia protein n=1 Tax=Dermatophagoides farinae TaxID=6954 RepID=A0A9D4NM97_DERFA|nr:copia protein [Dermatophagoides farinae]